MTRRHREGLRARAVALEISPPCLTPLPEDSSSGRRPLVLPADSPDLRPIASGA